MARGYFVQGDIGIGGGIVRGVCPGGIYLDTLSDRGRYGTAPLVLGDQSVE